MGEVKTFTEEHAEDVARLYFRAVRGQERAESKSLASYFTDLHLLNPWACPDLKPLIYIEKGAVVGALGVLPRTMDFRGRAITVATITLFMVDPNHRHGPAAIQLVGRVLKGPQEFSWLDGASGSVGAFWSALGGHMAPLYSLNWIRVLRVFGTAKLGFERLGTLGHSVNRVSGIMATPADLLVSKIPILSKPVSRYQFQLASPDQLLSCIREIGWRESLKPLYTPETFSWLMHQAAQARFGNLRMLTVCDTEGNRRGWFIYYAVRGGASFVLQIGAQRKTDFKDVLRALFRDAWDQGSACVKGAAIPQYLTAMTEELCFFRHPYDRAIVHSRNPEIANIVRFGEAAIARLDGVGWLRFSRENWDQ